MENRPISELETNSEISSAPQSKLLIFIDKFMLKWDIIRVFLDPYCNRIIFLKVSLYVCIYYWIAGRALAKQESSKKSTNTTNITFFQIWLN